MSTIYGIFHRGLQPVSGESSRQMEDSMNHWYADAVETVREGHVMMGCCLLHSAPESIGEIQPARIGSLTIVADARIDNRDELGAMLGLDKGQAEGMSDALMILHAYRSFGRQCPARLLGDFAFAIHDGEKDEIFCARDHLGVKPFFYFLDDNHFAFASEVRGLLSQVFVPRDLHEDFIHCLMAQITPPLNLTFHRYIASLEPSHFLVVGRDKTSSGRYWSLEIPPRMKLKSADEYAEAFRHEFMQAVGRRLRGAGRVGLELSGGLDSSSIAAAASRIVSDPDRLYSFSNVMPLNDQGVKAYPDEEEYIDAVTGYTGIRHVVKINRSGWRSFLEPLDLSLEVNQGVAPYHAWWQEPLRRAMDDAGVKVVLSGFVGDEGISAHAGSYYRELLWDGHLLPFFQEMIARSEYDLPLKAIAKKTLPAAWVRQWHKSRVKPYQRNSYLLDKKLEARLVAQYAEKEMDPGLSLRGQIAYRVTRRYTTNRMQSESLHAIPHRFEYRYPMADIRMLEFFLSVPLKYLGRKGQSRHLLREAIKGMVPEKVRLRSDKSGAPMIFYWEENRAMAGELSNWARNNLKSADGFLGDMDREKINRGYDPACPENYISGVFEPERPVELELLARYFTR